MSESALKSAYEKALALPETEQDEVAVLVEDFIEQRDARYHLTEEQKAEIMRRLADPNPVLIPQDEVFAAVRRRLGTGSPANHRLRFAR